MRPFRLRCGGGPRRVAGREGEEEEELGRSPPPSLLLLMLGLWVEEEGPGRSPRESSVVAELSGEDGGRPWGNQRTLAVTAAPASKASARPSRTWLGPPMRDRNGDWRRPGMRKAEETKTMRREG